ncbi:type II toxin-antitoxin system YafO family toxin [Hahella ganghwensis]|uniref:type II toxin-antitoxin system YafO family toxin n=1 Tax=Hahella ganghwensis TaxID=286420 RepID=UPI00036CDFA2|nr:type II toxin-antitoxin system YafO family toxin [Hahella ganghwensis]
MSNIQVKLHPSLNDAYQENLYFRQLVQDFKLFKKGVLIPYFGRDASYDYPQSIRDAGLLHIHILHDSSKAFQRRQKAMAQNRYIDPYSLTCDIGDPPNDKALVYTKGFLNENLFLILDFFSANAHDLAKPPSPRLRRLADMAREFRDQY